MYNLKKIKENISKKKDLCSKLKYLTEILPMRLIISVVVGIAIATVLSFLTHLLLHWIGLFPPLSKPMFDTKLLLITLIYHSLYAIGAAYVTAKIAGKKAKKAVFILGSKEAIMWLIGTFILWKHTLGWFNITKAVIGIPLAIIGGKIYVLHKKRKEENTEKLN